MKKVNKDLVAYKAAMRDMREQKMHTEVLNSRLNKEYIRRERQSTASLSSDSDHTFFAPLQMRRSPVLDR